MTHFHRTPRRLRRLPSDRTAATAIEYAMILALIALAIVSSIGVLGDGNRALIQRAADTVNRD